MIQDEIEVAVVVVEMQANVKVGIMLKILNGKGTQAALRNALLHQGNHLDQKILM